MIARRVIGAIMLVWPIVVGFFLLGYCVPELLKPVAISLAAVFSMSVGACLLEQS